MSGYGKIQVSNHVADRAGGLGAAVSAIDTATVSSSTIINERMIGNDSAFRLPSQQQTQARNRADNRWLVGAALTFVACVIVAVWFVVAVVSHLPTRNTP